MAHGFAARAWCAARDVLCVIARRAGVWVAMLALVSGLHLVGCARTGATYAPPSPDATPSPTPSSDFDKAVDKGDAERVRAMLREDPKLVKMADAYGYTALHRVASQGNQGVFEALVCNGADPNARSRLGETPLHIAAREGLPSIVKGLVHAGSDPNATDADGNTPLHEAAALGCFEIVEALISGGARATVRNYKRYTPLALAREHASHDVIDLLLQAAARE